MHHGTSRLLGVLATLAGLSITSISTAATPLIGGDFGGVIYDVNPATGAATNPRVTGLGQTAGFTASLDGQHAYALSSFGSAPPNSLFSVDLLTGQLHLIGATGLSLIGEGDLAIRPTDGTLFSVWNASGGDLQLFTLNVQTGAASVIGTVASSTDLSGMAFSPAGQLFILENPAKRIRIVDPATALTMSTILLTGVSQIGGATGFAFDPATGVLYMADGANNAANSLYTINLGTGAVSLVGSTGLAEGLSALAFVPEPTAAMILFAAVALLAGQRIRRRELLACR